MEGQKQVFEKTDFVGGKRIRDKVGNDIVKMSNKTITYIRSESREMNFDDFFNYYYDNNESMKELALKVWDRMIEINGNVIESNDVMQRSQFMESMRFYQEDALEEIQREDAEKKKEEDRIKYEEEMKKKKEKLKTFEDEDYIKQVRKFEGWKTKFNALKFKSKQARTKYGNKIEDKDEREFFFIHITRHSLLEKK